MFYVWATEKISIEGFECRKFLEAPMLEKFWNEHQSGLRNRSTELWIIMMLYLWQKNFGG